MGRRAALALGLAAALLALAAPPSPAAPERPRPGAAGIGDPLFPELGNGGYDALHYNLRLRYRGPGLKGTDGLVVVRARAARALSRFNLDFDGGPVRRVRVDGVAARWRREREELIVTPRRGLERGRSFRVEVAWTQPATGPDLPGRILTADGSATLLQPDSAHNLIPCNDHPRDKATWSFHLDVPAGVTAAANGELTGRRTERGRTRWSYEVRDPMPAELVQLAVGAFDITRSRGPRGLPLRDVTARRYTAELRPRLARTPGHVRWLEARLGSYPFETYGVLAVDAGFAFALETQTLSLFSAPVLAGVARERIEPIMVHELVHQWFGNSVSPRSWSDVWLNEGHATWYEFLYGAERGWRDLKGTMRLEYARADALRAAAGPVARPRSAELGVLFGDNVYQGGALVLYALRQKVGRRTFARIERAWVREHRDGVADTRDFIALAARIGGRDVGRFLRSWLFGTRTPRMPGHPDWKVSPVPPTPDSARAG